jgi:hypothetical protein
MSYQENMRRRLLKMPIVRPAAPWKPLPPVAIGGLTEGGYLPDSDDFLAITSAGRGLFDGTTGEKLGRDHDDSGSWIDEIHLVAASIAPKEGVQVKVAGLAGGGLPRSTKDGWRVESAAPDWPKEAVFLESIGSSVFIEDRAAGAQKIFEDYEPRVYGFSETGRSLVIGTSDTLYFFTR